MTLTPYQPSGLTNPEEAARAALTAEALPLLAILRKGAPRDGKKIGRELPYFRVDWRPGYEYLAEPFADLYGAEPDHIPGLRLIGASPFQFFYEAWHGNATLKARHDGRVFIKRWTPAGYDFEPLPVDQAPDLAAECTPVGRLLFWLPALAARTFEIGKFIAITTSINDCSGLYAYVQMLALAGAPVYDLDFELYREPRDFTVPVNGKPSKITKYMVRLRVMPGTARPALADSAARQVDAETGEISYVAADPDEPELIALRRMIAAEVRQYYDECKRMGVPDKQTAIDILGVEDIGDWQTPQPLLDALECARRWIEANTPLADFVEQPPLLDVPEGAPDYYTEGA